jgi:hypothetical protein
MPTREPGTATQLRVQKMGGLGSVLWVEIALLGECHLGGRSITISVNGLGTDQEELIV